MIYNSFGLLLVATTLLQLLHHGFGEDCKLSDENVKEIMIEQLKNDCLKKGFESSLTGCEAEGEPKLNKKQRKKCTKTEKKLEACDATCEGERNTHYTIQHETGKGNWDAGDTAGYMFTIVGTKGETAPFDCSAERTQGATGECTMEDVPDIGNIKEVKIYNSGDNYWCFLSLTINELNFGGKCVDDYQTETLSLAGEGVEYNILHETGTGDWDAGNTGGYIFTIVGTKGETSPHDCTSKRELESTGGCTIWDDADIGEIKDVKIYNSGDNYWCFLSLSVNGLDFGGKCVDDYQTETLSVAGEGVEYNIVHETGTGTYHGGNTGGYMFTIVGSKGETSPHDCTASRALGSTGTCTIWDDADIGEIKEVKIYNSGDNYWCFDSLTVNGLEFGKGCSDDYTTEVFQLS